MIVGLLHQEWLECPMFTVFNDKFHVLVMTESFPIKGSNYTRVFLSSVLEQWKLVHLISVFFNYLHV